MKTIFATLVIFQGWEGLGPLMQALPFVLIFVIFYFLLFLPTQRKQKQQREMLESLKNGDRVITTGGIRGTIVSLKDDSLYLRVAPQEVRLEVMRSAVASVEPQSEK